MLLILSGGINFFYPIAEPLNGHIFYQLHLSKKQPDLNSKIEEGATYFLNGGNYYLGNKSNSYSQFYTKSIQHIPTSFYWKYPIYESRDEFAIFLKDGKHYLNIRLADKVSLPVVSLIVNPDDFFSYERGIYVKGKEGYEKKQKFFYSEPWNQTANFYNTGRASKRKTFFSIYDNAGKHQYSTYCYVRVSGHATRSFPQKSLTLSTSKLIGDKNFKTDLFNDGNQYEDFVLRNGGNDNTKALFRDAFMQSYLQKFGLLTSRMQKPYNLYINGQYWGIHFMQNKFNSDFIAQMYDVKKKKVTVVENWKLEDGSEKEFTELMNFIKENIKHNTISLETISDYFDLENLTLYLAGEIFFANTDWPGNNIKLFKVSNNSEEEAKWQFAFFDLDYGLGYTGKDAVDMDMFEYLNTKKDHLSLLVKKLLLIPEFKLKLISQLYKFKNLDVEDINGYYDLINSSIDKHTERWRKPLNRKEWQDNVDEIKFFIERRYKVIENQIKAL